MHPPQMVPELSAAANDSLASDASAVSGEGISHAHSTAAASWLGQRQGKLSVCCAELCACRTAAAAMLLHQAPHACPVARPPMLAEELNRAYANHEIVGDHLTACLAWFEAGGTLPLAGLVQQVGCWGAGGLRS